VDYFIFGDADNHDYNSSTAYIVPAPVATPVPVPTISNTILIDATFDGNNNADGFIYRDDVNQGSGRYECSN